LRTRDPLPWREALGLSLIAAASGAVLWRLGSSRTDALLAKPWGPLLVHPLYFGVGLGGMAACLGWAAAVVQGIGRRVRRRRQELRGLATSITPRVPVETAARRGIWLVWRATVLLGNVGARMVRMGLLGLLCVQAFMVGFWQSPMLMEMWACFGGMFWALRRIYRGKLIGSFLAASMRFTKAVVLIMGVSWIFHCFIEPYRIPSGSMENTLLVGDCIYVDSLHCLGNRLPFLSGIPKLRWRPKRGDVVIFNPPSAENKDYVKRVIGLPGDMIEIRGRTVFINGTPLDEPYAVFRGSEPRSPTGGTNWESRTPLGPDMYYVMGDNRNNSNDSRWWGAVVSRKIKGKVMIIYYSWNAAGGGPGDNFIGHIRWERLGRRVR